ncbi:MAG: hypothetical protein PUK49_02730 [Oscillospiraceae bacterium]|nr:hypothetical protein [Oscillospiraceae bacterium]
MNMTDNEIKLAKASALKDVLIFLMDYKNNHDDLNFDTLYADIIQYLEETIDCYD